MKKLSLLFLALTAVFTLRAQWVDDPSNNTFLSNSSADAGEVILSTEPVNGDTYMQFMQMRSNGWVPTLQRMTFDGTPQWGNDGVTITSQTLPTWSQGTAMTATADGAVVTCFSNEDGQCVAIKINADGSYAWGEQGITLFNGQGGSRTELLAGDDGGVWALGADYDNSYLCYINADGTLNPTVTVSDNSGASCMFGQMVPTIGNSVLLVYEKESYAYTYFYDKELWVVGYTPDGVQIGPEVQLMTLYTMIGSYIHYVVPDGDKGGYAYIWHAGIGGAYNVYVFHFDEYGNSTISGLDGVAVHSTDPSNYYTSAYGTVDPISHDLIIAYEQTDSYSQSESRIYMNRITATGERLWGEGILVADNTGNTYSDILVDAFEDGSGFSLIYNSGDYNSTVRAIGFDMDGNQIWTKYMSSSSYARAMCDNSAGFHMGQNVVAWVNSANGSVYGQNIGPDGTMGPIEPIIPIPDCPAPENFDGEYVYDEETQTYGAQLTWTAPETQPLHYNLYVTDPAGCMTTVEIDPVETEYFDETTIIGTVMYRLTAVYDNCESDFALTPDGEDFVSINITGIEENTSDELITVLRIFNANGQSVAATNLDELKPGMYILQGLTKDGRLVNRKIVATRP